MTTKTPPPTTKRGQLQQQPIKNISRVVPYIQGLGEQFKRTCNKKGIKVHFKGSNTIKTLLMASKDKETKLQKSGVIYKYKCPHINCPEEYIGGTSRTSQDPISGPLPHPLKYQFHRTSK